MFIWIYDRNEQGADDAEVRGWEPVSETCSLLGYKGQEVCEVKEGHQALTGKIMVK